MPPKSAVGLFVVLAFLAGPAFSQPPPPKPKRLAISAEVALHYVERGRGEAIVFVHGLTGDYSVWTRQVEAFADEGFRAITYSRRYNFPNQNKLQPNHSAVVEADDLAALIRQLKLGKTHVVGFSYGAYTALMLALKHPELTRTVTLAEPPIASWLADLPGDQAAAGKAQLRKLRNDGIKPARAAFAAGNEQLAMQAMVDAIGGKGSFQRMPGFVKARCRRNIAEMKAIVTSNNAYPPVDREQVRRLAVPTLILSGSKSVATSRFTDPELERLIPKRLRKRVVLQGATHIMWVQQPVQCRNAVLAFIRAKD